ncbi:hypothetical protein DPMN_051698 [Dreissena polymorpha]|uniref:Uncharacterized protein n=1 Tax=Dreissena polymorpha TaxID=45954 RepID=A0A9D4HMD2_DREPO|nr:hypothetical protein DPMN_051698 [Dreissena polymorpha]
MGKTSAGTPSEGGGGGGGKAVGDDDCDYDKNCNADTDNSDDDNGDHEWIIIRPQTKFSGVYRSEHVCLSAGLSVESLSENQRPKRYFQYYMDKITNPAPA